MYCAKYSTTNRLVFRSASRPPFLPHYQGPQPTNAQHRISTQLPPSPPGSHSIRFADSGYSGVSAPPSAKSQPLQLDTSLMNPGISRAASTRFHDSCRSLYCRFRERLPTFFRVGRTIPGFHRNLSMQVQERATISSQFAQFVEARTRLPTDHSRFDITV